MNIPMIKWVRVTNHPLVSAFPQEYREGTLEGGVTSIVWFTKMLVSLEDS